MQARRRWQRPEQREVASVSASECGGVALASEIMWYADALVLVEMRVLYMYWLRACANCFPDIARKSHSQICMFHIHIVS